MFADVKTILPKRFYGLKNNMPSIDTLLTFAFAALLLSAAPGPSNFYIMARSIGQGHQAGIAAAGGMAVGSFIYVLATAMGLAAIFKYSPLAYTFLKVVGAAYLIYLGTQYFLSTGTSTSRQKLQPIPLHKIFRQSIVVELTNPKTALFFIAFLPQFVDVQGTNVTMQLVILGTVYAFIAMGSDILVALLSGKLGNWLAHHPAFIRWQDRFSGSLLFTLGTFIVYQEISGEAP
ncbi:MAG: threonine/homoserine/homoserine lactone efflux protein [Paraglaciecola sp.]